MAAEKKQRLEHLGLGMTPVSDGAPLRLPLGALKQSPPLRSREKGPPENLCTQHPATRGGPNPRKHTAGQGLAHTPGVRRVIRRTHCIRFPDVATKGFLLPAVFTRGAAVRSRLSGGRLRGVQCIVGRRGRILVPDVEASRGRRRRGCSGVRSFFVLYNMNTR